MFESSENLKEFETCMHNFRFQNTLETVKADEFVEAWSCRFSKSFDVGDIKG